VNARGVPGELSLYLIGAGALAVDQDERGIRLMSAVLGKDMQQAEDARISECDAEGEGSDDSEGYYQRD